MKNLKINLLRYFCDTLYKKNVELNKEKIENFFKSVQERELKSSTLFFLRYSDFRNINSETVQKNTGNNEA